MHIQCILPHLDYCCVIWGNCSRSLEEKKVRFQKRAGRLILTEDFDYNHISIFSVKMDDFHRKSNLPESYSNV